MGNNQKSNSNAILWILLIVVVVASLVVGTKNGALEGADGLAEEAITNYEPWFEPFWEPPSGEIESGIFALQAAIGGIVIGYYIGKKKNAKTTTESFKDQ